MRILFFPTTTPTFTESVLSLTPKVSLIKNSLYLDIEPTIKLFKGEENLFLKAMQLSETFSLNSHFVMTDRPEWAQALNTRPEVFFLPGKSTSPLLNLDISRLEFIGDPQKLEEEKKERTDLIRFMKRVGLKTITDFTHLSATAIGRRFGKMGVILLDWVLGNRELILPTFVPEGLIQERIETEELTSLESLLHELPPVLKRVESRLIGRAQMVKSLELNFHLESRNKLQKQYSLSDPTQSSEILLKLLRELLSDLNWDSPLQSLEVSITDTVPYTPGQLSLFETGESLFSDLSQYLTRLRAKFGDTQVGFPLLKESYLPEKSWAPTWPPQEKESSHSTPHRPLFLFTPPKLCHPLNSWKLIASENLMTEWWSSHGIRKYFIAIPPQGSRLWLYWDLEEKAWYAHGTFD